MAFVAEQLLEGDVVLDDAVVDQRDAAVTGQVRVSVAFRRRAVSGPAGMGDPHPRFRERLAVRNDLLEHADSTDRAADVQVTRASHHRDPRGIVATILQPLEALDEQRLSHLATHVGNDSAHARSSFEGTTPSTRALVIETGATDARSG